MDFFYLSALVVVKVMFPWQSSWEIQKVLSKTPSQLQTETKPISRVVAMEATFLDFLRFLDLKQCSETRNAILVSRMKHEQ